MSNFWSGSDGHLNKTLLKLIKLSVNEEPILPQTERALTKMFLEITSSHLKSNGFETSEVEMLQKYILNQRRYFFQKNEHLTNRQQWSNRQNRNSGNLNDIKNIGFNTHVVSSDRQQKEPRKTAEKKTFLVVYKCSNAKTNLSLSPARRNC